MKLKINSTDAKWIITGFAVMFVLALATWAGARAYVDTKTGWRHLALMYDIIKGSWQLASQTMLALVLAGVVCLVSRLWRYVFISFLLSAVSFALMAYASCITQTNTITDRPAEIVMRSPDVVEAFGRTYNGSELGYYAWKMQNQIGLRWELVAEVELSGGVTAGDFFQNLGGFRKTTFKSTPQCIVYDYDAYACIEWCDDKWPVYLRVGKDGNIHDTDALADAASKSWPIVLVIAGDANAKLLERTVAKVAQTGVTEVYVSRKIAQPSEEESAMDFRAKDNNR